jgi:hypothetical protein
MPAILDDPLGIEKRDDPLGLDAKAEPSSVERDDPLGIERPSSTATTPQPSLHESLTADLSSGDPARIATAFLPLIAKSNQALDAGIIAGAEMDNPEGDYQKKYGGEKFLTPSSTMDPVSLTPRTDAVTVAPTLPRPQDPEWAQPEFQHKMMVATALSDERDAINAKWDKENAKLNLVPGLNNQADFDTQHENEQGRVLDLGRLAEASKAAGFDRVPGDVYDPFASRAHIGLYKEQLRIDGRKNCRRNCRGTIGYGEHPRDVHE